jgi:choline/glycine/proline betaine transport protein
LSDTGSTPKPTLQRRLGLRAHPVVFPLSAGLIFAFVASSLIFIESVEPLFARIQTLIANRAGWFLVLVVNVYLGFVVFLMLSRFGHVRLGRPGEAPEFSRLTWFSMLFSAGMGIGLLFFSVAEPIYHFTAPPFGEGGTLEAARQAMALTFFHWGLHAWGIYALVGLALAFFCFNRGLPLTIRSAFHPLLGERIHGPLGDAVDTLAAVATLFGVATSLGLGVQQINSGLDHVLGIGRGLGLQILLIAVITAAATASVVSGVNRGIRRLSELNLGLGLLLMLSVLVAGPTLFLLDSLVQNVGRYLQDFARLSFWTEAYRFTYWQNDWTIFYWAWWIAWSPFVGMFIARVSRGRSVREFLVGVLFVPTGLTFVWLSIFGGAALHQELFGSGGIAAAVAQDMPIALFVLLERYPFAGVTSLLGVLIVVTFFVTSSDSASLVIDIITGGGELEPPTRQRVFWAVTEGVVAAVLLAGGGLTALQTAAICTGLPFAVVLLFMAWSLYKGVSERVGDPLGAGAVPQSASGHARAPD